MRAGAGTASTGGGFTAGQIPLSRLARVPVKKRTE
jgi:hypothetical protein